MFLLELSQERLCGRELVVENLARDVEQIGDELIAQGIPHTHARLTSHYDIVRPQHAELLRHDGLAKS